MRHILRRLQVHGHRICVSLSKVHDFDFPSLMIFCRSECYCGNTIAAGSVLTTSGCTMTCAGNANEYCGGPNRLNFYQVSGTTTSSQSTSSKTSSISSTSSTTSSQVASTSPAVVQSSSNFTYVACYTDSTASRSLPNQVVASDKLTVEICLSACQNYAYAGIEYGRECWCGNTLGSAAAQATSEKQCSMTCPGNPSQICGDGNRLTLYSHNAAKPQAKLSMAKVVPNDGASSSSTTSSVSSSSSSVTSSSTSQSSTGSSSSKTTSSSSASIVSSTSTSGSSSQTSSIVSTRSSSSSSTTSQATSSSSSSSVTSKSSSSTSSSTVATLVPTPSQTIGGYTYLGCANQTSPLALVGMSKVEKKTTTETCQQYCLENNYGLAATQNGDTCYCGNGLQSYSAVGQKTCNVPCSGNKTEVCGGATSLSVWNSTSSTIPPTTVKAVGAYPLQGCYSGAKLLSGATHTSATGLTVESCVGYCITKGYTVAGVQDGKTCLCDSKLAATKKKEELSSCNRLCAGNKREFCGAYDKLLVYSYDAGSVTNGVPKSMNTGNKATITANTTAEA